MDTETLSHICWVDVSMGRGKLPGYTESQWVSQYLMGRQGLEMGGAAMIAVWLDDRRLPQVGRDCFCCFCCGGADGISPIYCLQEAGRSHLSVNGRS